ncbi:hypothetical protein BJV82DRAFT_618223 [Fennellomyces sp. T-0311]|nr:hypothetical protein BJV82DRAFT_618223 [Fennellomyces sp. T-0311]
MLGMRIYSLRFDRKKDKYGNPYHYHFPLKAMHEYRRKKKFGPIQDASDLSYHENFKVFPWDLDIDELQYTAFEADVRCLFAHTWFTRDRPLWAPIPSTEESKAGDIQRHFGLYIRCASCNAELFFATWAQYEDYRTNPNVTFRCANYFCKNPNNTVDSAAVSELLSSLPYKIKGTMLHNNTGTLKGPYSEEEAAILERLACTIRSRQNSIKSIREVCAHLNDPNLLLDVAGMPFLNEDQMDFLRAYARDLAKIIRSTYENNPTCLSLDLIQAMHRQREFIDTIITKITPKWSNPLEREIPDAIRDYHDFLLINKSERPNALILPSWCVDMVWHVHMLHFASYYSTTFKNLGRILNHDDTVAPFQLNERLRATEKAWGDASSWVNVLSKTRQSFGSLIPPVMAKRVPHVYENLQSSMINHHARTRKIKNSKSFTEFQDLSYHGLDNASCFLKEKSKSGMLSTDPRTTYEDIFKGIQVTSYGYIGKIVPRASDKTVMHTPAAPSYYNRRMFGCIKPGSEIKRATRSDATMFGKNQWKLHVFDKLLREFQWWMPKNGIYGLMRRKYSTKHNQWGWTTNGLDWYSHNECNFVTSSRKRFGARFQESGHLSGNQSLAGRGGGLAEEDYGNGNFDTGDDGDYGGEDAGGGDDSGGGGDGGM